MSRDSSPYQVKKTRNCPHLLPSIFPLPVRWVSDSLCLPQVFSTNQIFRLTTWNSPPLSPLIRKLESMQILPTMCIFLKGVNVQSDFRGYETKLNLTEEVMKRIEKSGKTALKVFSELDSEKNGCISERQLRKCLKHCDVSITDQNFATVFSAFVILSFPHSQFLQKATILLSSFSPVLE